MQWVRFEHLEHADVPELFIPMETVYLDGESMTVDHMPDEHTVAVCGGERTYAAAELTRAADMPEITYEKIGYGCWKIMRGDVRMTSHLIAHEVCQSPKSYCAIIVDDQGKQIGRSPGVPIDQTIHWVSAHPGTPRPGDTFHFPNGLPEMSDAEREFIWKGRSLEDPNGKPVKAAKKAPAARVKAEPTPVVPAEPKAPTRTPRERTEYVESLPPLGRGKPAGATVKAGTAKGDWISCGRTFSISKRAKPADDMWGEALPLVVHDMSTGAECAPVIGEAISEAQAKRLIRVYVAELGIDQAPAKVKAVRAPKAPAESVIEAAPEWVQGNEGWAELLSHGGYAGLLEKQTIHGQSERPYGTFTVLMGKAPEGWTTADAWPGGGRLLWNDEGVTRARIFATIGAARDAFTAHVDAQAEERKAREACKDTGLDFDDLEALHGHFANIQQSTNTHQGQWWVNCHCPGTIGGIISHPGGDSWCTTYAGAVLLWLDHVEEHQHRQAQEDAEPVKEIVQAPPVEVAAPAPVLPSTGRGYWEIGARVIFEGRHGTVVSARVGKTIIRMDGAEPGHLEHLEPRSLVAERYVVCGSLITLTVPSRPEPLTVPDAPVCEALEGYEVPALPELVVCGGVMMPTMPEPKAVDPRLAWMAYDRPEPVDPRISWMDYTRPEPVGDVLAELRAELESIRADVDTWGGLAAATVVANAEQIVRELSQELRLLEVEALRKEARELREGLGWGPIVVVPVEVPSRVRPWRSLFATAASVAGLAGVGWTEGWTRGISG